eukprot:GILJ01008690.1.p1 GENE.GILJ01008690.1~~GILJ01008690.1.p1  ORF type:complete len:1240 (+),score=147.43 GILJ01008690.1:25-3720(+)
MKHFIFVVLCFVQLVVGVWSIAATNGTVLEKQVSYLKKLYASTKGAEWVSNKGWLTDQHPCTWMGITCNYARTHIDSVMLSWRGLVGELPEDAHLLGPIVTFAAEGNYLSGPIPQEFFFLPSLEQLFLSDNDLNCELGMYTFPNTSRLVILDLSKNKISTELTGSIGNMGRLEQLMLDRNYFYGTIPHELTLIPNLEQINLAKNLLEGPIPEGFANLPNLHIFDVKLNQLTGPIPPGFARSATLTVFDVAHNKLNGTLPDNWHLTSKMVKFRIKDNRITGSLPASLGNLVNLQMLDLNLNFLEGPIPGQYGQLTKLRKFAVGNNRLTGPVPAFLLDFLLVEHVDISGNYFELLPPGIGSTWNKIDEFNCTSNDLHGLIPAELLYNPSIQRLYLSENFFEGPIPEYPKLPAGVLKPFSQPLGNFSIPTKLVDLRISHNNLTSLPSSLILLNKLKVAYLSHNLFDFSADPVSYWMLPYLSTLQLLDLSFNPLQCDWESFCYTFLPEQRGANLITMKLSYCGLSGQLESKIIAKAFRRIFPSLNSLYISGNKLEGQLFKKLPKYMTELVVSDNPNITGDVPENYAQLKMFRGTNTALTGFLPLQFDPPELFKRFDNLRECPSEFRKQDDATLSIFILDPKYDEYESCRCVPGAYGDWGTCTLCPVDTYQDVAGAVHGCISCPLHSTTLNTTGASSKDACLCEPGYYWIQDQCAPCPANYMKLQPGRQQCDRCPEQGVSCFGGPSSFMPGYWRSSHDLNSVTDFYECPIPEVCVVNGSSGVTDCYNGHTGPMCLACQPRHSKIGDYCYECWSMSLLVPLFLISIFISIPLAIYLVKRNMQEKDDIAIVGRITLNSLQVLSSSMTMLQNQPPATYKKATAWMVLANGLAVGGFLTDCLFNMTFYEKYALQMAVPVIVGVTTSVGIFLAIKYRQWKGLDATTLRRSAIPAIVILLFFLYNRLVNEVFRMFDCYPDALPDRRTGNYYLREDMTVLCFEVQAVVANSFFLAIYVIGIPMAAALKLLRNKTRLTDPDFRVRYGFVYAGYARNFFLWELMVILPRKLLVSSIGAFVDDSALQIFLSMCVTCVAIFLQNTFKPFDKKEFNLLESCALYVTLIQQSFAHFYTFIESKNDMEMSEQGKRVWGVIICAFMLLAVCSFVIFVIALVFRRGWMREKMMKVHEVIKNARGMWRRKSSLARADDAVRAAKAQRVRLLTQEEDSDIQTEADEDIADTKDP